jgi:hypothetical protein
LRAINRRMSTFEKLPSVRELAGGAADIVEFFSSFVQGLQASTDKVDDMEALRESPLHPHSFGCLAQNRHKGKCVKPELTDRAGEIV